MKFINALVVKLVDTKDLKSLPLAECQFESGRGHHQMSNPQIIFDKNKKSIIIKNQLIKKINQYKFKNPNLFIVIGGDGFMLQTLKKNKNSEKSLFMELIQEIMDF
jgi:NAD kinase